MHLKQTHENLVKFVELLKECNWNASRAGKKLGLKHGATDRWKKTAIRRGLIEPFKGIVPVGFEVRTSTNQYDKDGTLVGRSVKMGDPKGDEFKVPKGQRVKGVSALLDSEGHEKIKWVKTENEKPSQESIIKYTKKAFRRWKPCRPTISIPQESETDRLILFPVLDWHLGMFAWAEETKDADWDLGIAKKVLVKNFTELVHEAPDAGRATMMCLGDLLHADNSMNRTARNGNPLDVDTRYGKVLQTAAEVTIECCDIIATKYHSVDVTLKRGNHDDESTHALRLAMQIEHRNSKHVKVDGSRSDFYYNRFGVNLIGGTHGDKQKISELPMHMANAVPHDWAASSTRHYFTGHIHHETSKEFGGVLVRTLRAPIPQDAWHAGVGFLSGRSMYCFKYDAHGGSRGSNELEMQI